LTSILTGKETASAVPQRAVKKNPASAAEGNRIQ
jgi:hypothetical protein